MLVHGWGMSSSVWNALVPELSRRYRLIRVDLPGHGRSRGLPFESTEAVVAQLGRIVSAPAHWVGWSLGGVLALALALRRPELVKRLVLVSSTPRFVQAPDWPRAMAPEVLAAFAAGLEADYEATLSRFLALQFRGVKGAQAALRQLRADLAATPPDPQALRGGLAVLRDSDLRAGLDRLGCPLRVILGELDALVPAAVAPQIVDGRVNARAAVIPGAGHAPFLSHATVFTETLHHCLHD